MAGSSGLTPRQKMINLMYIVLTAMLALNVSSDVLDGFTQVDEGLNRSNSNVAGRNDALFGRLSDFADQNPEKGKPWLERASEVRDFTAAILARVDSLKFAIVRKADGSDANPNDILHRDDLEASAAVMLNPATLEGQKLRLSLDSYRDFIAAQMPDSIKRQTVTDALSTANLDSNGKNRLQTWEETNFEAKPVVAAVTLLSKLENDIRYAEGEALTAMLNAVDAGDVRVNELNAFVIPRSRSVMRGGKYSANIVLAAVDTTQRPQIFIGGKQLPEGGLYEFQTGSTGSFDYSGYLEVTHGDGTTTRHPFSSEYTVFEPTATVSATMMNVLYAGIDNPLSISVPGVHNNRISATMSNGTLTRQGDNWIARPSAVGQEAVITVTANVDGTNQTMGTTTFRTRKLPDPTPFIAYKDAQGNPDRYRGGGKALPKATLLASPGIEAAIDDELLNIKFNVISFQTVVFDQSGNNLIETSNGANFSDAQKRQFRELKRGKRFIITNVKATGPDGVTRTISPLDVLVN